MPDVAKKNSSSYTLKWLTWSS